MFKTPYLSAVVADETDDGPRYEPGEHVACAKLEPSRLGRHRLPFPKYREPRQIGCFSLDGHHEFVDDASSEAVLSLPLAAADNSGEDVHFDLSAGYDTNNFREKEDKLEYLDSLLMWILHHRQLFQPKPDHDDQLDPQPNLLTDFVCWRGLLTKLLCSPYENKEGWIIAVTKFRGTYYMCEFETYEKHQQKKQATSRDRLMTYWGHKFETFVTTDDPSRSPKPEAEMSLLSEFCVVTRTRLKAHSLVFGAETDCTDTQCKLRPPANYVELKTSRLIETPGHARSFLKFKLKKWWAQSFLPGIPRVLCGMRDDSGIVRKLEWYDVRDMPRRAKELGQDAWSASECMNFLEEFLTFVRETVTADDANVVHKLTWYPYQLVEVERFTRPCDVSFLPAWYCDAIDLKIPPPPWENFVPGGPRVSMAPSH